MQDAILITGCLIFVGANTVAMAMSQLAGQLVPIARASNFLFGVIETIADLLLPKMP